MLVGKESRAAGRQRGTGSSRKIQRAQDMLQGDSSEGRLACRGKGGVRTGGSNGGGLDAWTRDPSHICGVYIFIIDVVSLFLGL